MINIIGNDDHWRQWHETIIVVAEAQWRIEGIINIDSIDIEEQSI